MRVNTSFGSDDSSVNTETVHNYFISLCVKFFCINAISAYSAMDFGYFFH